MLHCNQARMKATYMNNKISYGDAIRQGFEYLLKEHDDVFIMGQGLWAKWYVGNTMTDLDKKFGKDRVMDSPVSEAAVTGAAIGASLCGYRPIIVHPRMDFMMYAMDQLVNQAAKWSYMFGGQARPAVTIRAIVNRGGEQGAQHSQALHSWFAHTPGIRVVMPWSANDARDLLIASVLCNDPVIYIDDRWLYEDFEDLKPVKIEKLSTIGPKVILEGADLTLVGIGFATKLCREVARQINGVTSIEVIDMRILSPIKLDLILNSVKKTGRLIVVDGGTKTCGYAGEIIAGVAESLNPSDFKARPVRVTLPDTPAPTSPVLEAEYYISAEKLQKVINQMMQG